MHLIFVTHPLLGLFGIYSALLNTVTRVYGSTKVYSYTFSLALRLSWIDWSLNGFPPSLSIKPFSYSISDCSVFSHRDPIYILTYWASSGASQRCCSKGVIQIPTGNLTTKIHFSACSSTRLSSPNCHEPRKHLVFFCSHPASTCVCPGSSPAIHWWQCA